MSTYVATVKFEIESDDLSTDDIIAHFDNQASDTTTIEVDLVDPDGDDEVGTMVFTSVDASVEVVQY